MTSCLLPPELHSQILLCAAHISPALFFSLSQTCKAFHKLSLSEACLPHLVSSPFFLPARAIYFARSGIRELQLTKPPSAKESTATVAETEIVGDSEVARVTYQLFEKTVVARLGDAASGFLGSIDEAKASLKIHRQFLHLARMFVGELGTRPTGRNLETVLSAAEVNTLLRLMLLSALAQLFRRCLVNTCGEDSTELISDLSNAGSHLNPFILAHRREYGGSEDADLMWGSSLPLDLDLSCYFWLHALLERKLEKSRSEIPETSLRIELAWAWTWIYGRLYDWVSTFSRA